MFQRASHNRFNLLLHYKVKNDVLRAIKSEARAYSQTTNRKQPKALLTLLSSVLVRLSLDNNKRVLTYLLTYLVMINSISESLLTLIAN